MDTIKFDDQKFEEEINKIEKLRDLVDQTESSMVRACRMLSAETDKFDEVTRRLCQKMRKIHDGLDNLQSQGSQVIRVYGDTETYNIKLVEKLKTGSNTGLLIGKIDDGCVPWFIRIMDDQQLVSEDNYINPNILHERWILKSNEAFYKRINAQLISPLNSDLISRYSIPLTSGVRPYVPSFEIFRRGGER